MELKRVLGSDSRSATAEAAAKYGKDALIVSNERVNGKVEVIVAVEMEHEQFESLEPAGIDSRRQDRINSTNGSKGDIVSGRDFGEILQGRLSETIRAQPINLLKSNTGAICKNEADIQELDRAKDLVDMLRGEFAQMRKELLLSQKLGAWQSTSGISEAVQPLAIALLEVGVPIGLRSLLIDEIKGLDNLGEALSVVESNLRSAICLAKKSGFLEGVHVIAGPSGAGKTMMVGRLAAMHVKEGAFQCDEVAVVSFNDKRVGAWSQIQMLLAQSGVVGYRVNDQAMLESVLPELLQKKVVLIDTSGVNVSENLKAIASVANKAEEKARFHLLLPADASAATIKRFMDQPDLEWETIMLSKIDESTQPWPLIQALCERHLPLSFASCAPTGLESLGIADAVGLVGLAMSNLPLEGLSTADSDQLVLANAGPNVWRSGRKELQS